MTREEKIELLNKLLEIEEKNDIGNLTRAERGEFQQWINDAIEQESCDKCVYSTKDGCQYDDITETIPPFKPCDDAISRQAVLDATVKKNSIWNKITNSKGENLEEIILQLPSVNPQDKYKKAAMDLLAEYLESEQSVISEFSGDFKKSAMMLKKRVMKYLKRLDESENTFNELVKDMWIAEYYEAESEGEHE